MFNIKDCVLCVTNRRLFLVNSQAIIFELSHFDIQGLKRQKFQTDSITEFARLRIVDCNGQKYDLKFCERKSKEELIKCYHILRNLWKTVREKYKKNETQNGNSIYNDAVRNVYSELVEKTNILSDKDFPEGLQENINEQKKKVIFLDNKEEKPDDFQVFDMLKNGKKKEPIVNNTSFEEINDYSQQFLNGENIPFSIDHFQEDEKEETSVENANNYNFKRKEYEVSDELKSDCNEFVNIIRSYNDSFNSIPILNQGDFKDAIQILDEITPNNVNFLKFETKDFNNIEIKQGLDILKTHKFEEQLLLYHFWINYNDNSAQSKEKAKRLQLKINEFNQILQAEKQQILSQNYKYLSPIYEEIEFSINKVLSLDL